MSPRQLTNRERVVLAHTARDPDGWWAHVCSKDGSDGKRALDAEECLRAKVATHGGDYDAAVAAEGADYKNRVARDAADAERDAI